MHIYIHTHIYIYIYMYVCMYKTENKSDLMKMYTQTYDSLY